QGRAHRALAAGGLEVFALDAAQASIDAHALRRGDRRPLVEGRGGHDLEHAGGGRDRIEQQAAPRRRADLREGQDGSGGGVDERGRSCYGAGIAEQLLRRPLQRGLERQGDLLSVHTASEGHVAAPLRRAPADLLRGRGRGGAEANSTPCDEQPEGRRAELHGYLVRSAPKWANFSGEEVLRSDASPGRAAHEAVRGEGGRGALHEVKRSSAEWG